MSDDGPATRPTGAPISPGPDTEQMAPLTPDSQHISVEHASSPVTRTSGTNLEAPRMTPESKALLSATERSQFSPLESRPALPPQNNSHTTLQSMTRPEVAGDGTTNVRRFIAIERGLDETSASTKLLEKRVKALEIQLKITWFGTGLLLGAVVLSLLL